MDQELSRREFLKVAATAAGVVIICNGCSHEEPPPGPPGGPPPAGPGAPKMTGVAAVKNPDGTFTVPGGGALEPGTGMAFLMPGDAPGLIYLTSDGKLGALSGRCTHMGGQVQFQGGQIVCPWHNSHFGFDGKPDPNAKAKQPLAVFDIKKQGKDAIVTVKA